MKKIKLTLVFCLIVMICLAQNSEWTVTSSTIKFKIKNAGFMVDGTFGGLEAKINFDATKSYSNSIEANIEAKTINTGNNSRDKHLKKEEYFSIEKYPKIILNASTFAKQPDGSFKGYFKLTIKSTTKDVVMPFTFSESNTSALIKGSFAINRIDYEIGESGLILSNNATISIEAKLTKK